MWSLGQGEMDFRLNYNCALRYLHVLNIETHNSVVTSTEECNIHSVRLVYRGADSLHLRGL